MEETRVRYFVQTMGTHSMWKIVEGRSEGRKITKFFKRMDCTEWKGGDAHEDVRRWKLQGEKADGWKLSEKKGRKKARVIEEQAIRKGSAEAIGKSGYEVQIHGRKYKRRSEPPRYSYELREITEDVPHSHALPRKMWIWLVNMISLMYPYIYTYIHL